MHFICHADDIKEGASKGFIVNGMAIFGVKQNGSLFFYKNRCPHLGAEMEWMDDEFLNESRELIRCQFHGALFKIENGECVSGPCAGDKLTKLEVLVDDSAVYYA